MVKRIEVSSPEGTYPILIKEGLLQSIQEISEIYDPSTRFCIITNPTIAPLYADSLSEKLNHAPILLMQDGEVYKNLETVSDLYRQLIKAGADRYTVIVALGGGVVGDTAGFVAATYMRGLDFIQIPTTLLAMVDSSVGAKVGVDLPEGKNLVGAFKQPKAVLIDPTVLDSLPALQIKCGMAEVIKHGFIANPDLLDPELHQASHYEALVYQAVKVKVDVVEQDPFEKGIRAHLNFGHTFGHAIEQVTHYGWLHGEAVGIGQLLAARLSQRLNLCDQTLVDRVYASLVQLGLPTSLEGLSASQIYEAMLTDKKWKDGHSRFVLLRDVGQACVIHDVDRQLVESVLLEYGAGA